MFFWIEQHYVRKTKFCSNLISRILWKEAKASFEIIVKRFVVYRKQFSVLTKDVCRIEIEIEIDDLSVFLILHMRIHCKTRILAVSIHEFVLTRWDLIFFVLIFSIKILSIIAKLKSINFRIFFWIVIVYSWTILIIHETWLTRFVFFLRKVIVEFRARMFKFRIFKVFITISITRTI
jgi:hypothetical protein